jgi:hypothetical protein
MAESQQEVPPARAGHESVLLDGRTFVWGGTKTGGGYHSRANVFSVNMLSRQWHEHPVTPPDTSTPCYGACSAAIGNTIYSFGGQTNEKCSDEFYNLDINEMRWRKTEVEGIKPDGRRGAGMCQINGKLLLMGGFGPITSRNHPQAQYKESEKCKDLGWNNELFEFDPQTKYWCAVSVTGSKPSPRQNHTLTAVDDKRAVLFGGSDGDNQLNDLWLFYYGTKVWTEIPPSSSLWPQPRSYHTVCTMMRDNQKIKLLLIGGYPGSDCWLLDVHEGIGEKVTFDSEPVKRYGHSAHCFTLVSGTVVVSVFGGWIYPSSDSISIPYFYKWKPSHPNALCLAGTTLTTVSYIC